MAEVKSVNLKPIRVVAVFIAIAVIFLGIYVSGSFAIPGMIKASYQAKNCWLALGLDSFSANMYPARPADQSIAGPVNECAVYSVATSNEGQKAWQDSYHAYKTYIEIYPTGPFAAEAHERGALVLTALAKEQTDQKKYGEAVGSLNLVLDRYGDTGAVTEASTMMPEVYTAWGAHLRNSGDFVGSKNTLRVFNSWAENAGKPESVQSADRELAQTYLAWGLALQSQKKFEDSKIKLDLAVSTDPEPLSDSGPAAQAKTAQAQLQTQWADSLREQKDFAEAIEHYKTALSLSESKDRTVATQALTDSYLSWAASLSSSEDFLGALKQVEEAGKTAGTAAVKQAVEDARTGIYTAFSRSDGVQAQNAIQDAAQSICKDKKKPDLPIFGVNPDKILAAFYGVEDKLPENVAAKTPGDLHYVACAEDVVETVERKQISISAWYRTFATMIREKHVWDITLWRIDGSEANATTRIEGGAPPPISSEPGALHAMNLIAGSVHHFAGTKPDIVELANWLLTVMK